MSYFQKKYTVTRNAPGTFLDGTYVNGLTTTFTIMASAQPLKPEVIQKYNFGRRNSKFMFLITETKLNVVTAAPATGKPGTLQDIVTFAGEQYNVEKEEIWGNSVIPHYKYLIVKVIED